MRCIYFLPYFVEILNNFFLTKYIFISVTQTFRWFSNFAISVLNPNPKTAADYRKNTQVMKMNNLNHEDDIFQTKASKVKLLSSPSRFTGIKLRSGLIKLNLYSSWY
jgi:hypothetical protein